MSSDRGNRQAVDWSTRQCWHPQLKTSSYWAYHRHSVSKCDNTGAFKTKSERLFYCAVGSPFGYSVFLLYNLHCTLYNKNENIAVFISYCFHKEHRESFFNFFKAFFLCVCVVGTLSPGLWGCLRILQTQILLELLGKAAKLAIIISPDLCSTYSYSCACMVLFIIYAWHLVQIIMCQYVVLIVRHFFQFGDFLSSRLFILSQCCK